MKTLLIIASFFYTLSAISFDHTHKDWNVILKKHVQRDGYQTYVNYQAIKNSPSKLNKYLKSLSSVTQKEFAKFSNDQKLSFLINSYNAFTVKLIINHYPVDSIKDIGSFFKSPWKRKFFTFLGEKRHLDDLEHNLIRKNFNEPRIHFAVVCASIGCPPLLKHAYTESNLEKLLQKASEDFLKDKNKNYVLIDKRRIYLSKIFKWYGEDFEKKHGSLIKSLKLYIKDPMILEALDRDEFDIRFTSYDWNLNEYKDL